jgi:hypothetical protein
MKTFRMFLAAVASIAGVLTFAVPADASPLSITIGLDTASWDPATNILKVCDGTTGDGTAMALLAVYGGGQWRLFDDNGAQPGCNSAGPLSVDETKSATLYICTNSACESYKYRTVPL